VLNTEIPAEFYDAAPIQQAVARFDFGTLFLAIRQQTGLSQCGLAELTGLTQGRISEVENGNRRIRHVDVVARIATVLRIPPSLLGFTLGDSATRIPQDHKGGLLDSGDFLTAIVHAVTLGSAPQPDANEWMHSPVAVPPYSPSKTVTVADVETVEATTRFFRDNSLRRGGSLTRSTAAALLATTLAIRPATVPVGIGSRLQLAVADLATATAWMYYDTECHDRAANMLRFAAQTATDLDAPGSTDRIVAALLGLVHQQLHLDRATTALRVVHLAATTAISRRDPISPAYDAYIATYLAWCHATLGDSAACLRALDIAADRWDSAEQSPDASRGPHISASEITARHGHCYVLMSRRDSPRAAQAVSMLETAVADFAVTAPRSRAANLPGLATAYLRTGDLDAAVRTGREALDTILALGVPRLLTRLRSFRQCTTPFKTRPDVADLRHHLATALTAPALTARDTGPRAVP
jgi:transcriptional regulator with XRE-family HTH domain